MTTWRCILAMLGVFIATEALADPVRVFILAGQSNMEGKGAIEHLEQLLADPATEETYKHLRDGDDWGERDDVYIKYNDDRGHGKLSVGYATPTNCFGPELQFGHVVGDALKEPVLIIKCAWGGRALAVRFRPPSSGLGDYTKRDKETKELMPLAPETYGEAYRDTIRIVKETLADIGSIIPEYDDFGYELSGFVFFQGFNDIIDAKKTEEYGANLANLIRDVRKDLDAPGLPFIIGELGQQGAEPEQRYAEKHLRFRRIQKDVANMDEFKDTVRFVETSLYVVKDGKRFDGGYHYMGRADTFFHIGQAFGKAILPLASKEPRIREAK
ncbi:MAG: sialate O-acetylesterase [Planctomycetota bacterium]|jgi:alpha-galactosidase